MSGYEKRCTEKRQARAMALRKLRRRRRQLDHEIHSLDRGDIDDELLKIYRENKNVSGNEQKGD